VYTFAKESIFIKIKKMKRLLKSIATGVLYTGITVGYLVLGVVCLAPVVFIFWAVVTGGSF